MGVVLQSDHFRAVTDAVTHLRSLPEDGDLLLAMLHIVDRAIPGSLVRFSAIDPASCDCIGVNSHVISEDGDDLDNYAPRILDNCPFTQAQLRQQPGVVRLSDLVSPTRFWDSESFAVFYRPAASRYSLSALLSPPGFAPMISIDIDRDATDFTAEEVACFELLRPHLREAYERICAIERARRGMTARRRWRPGGAAEHVTFDARLRQGTGRPAALNSALDFALPRSFAEAVWLHYGSFERDDFAPGQGWDLSRTVSDPAGDITLRMVWDPAADHTILSARPGAALDQRLRLRELGLSAREAEVLFWLAEGKSNDVIGELLSLSARTVQKHVENVHRKLGVESRTAAAVTAVRWLNDLA